MKRGDRSRDFLKDARRVIVKVGTSVVTRPDGKLAVGRLGALCEQVKDIMDEHVEVIVVTSGAVAVGRQKLRQQRMMNCSFADLQKPQTELSGKACASIGQSGLMALYDSIFSQLDVASSQLLVTDRDFTDSDFRKQLCETVDTLLRFRVVPIFNENDAVSTRKAPYKDASGIFWDNDSLAALLALELKVDLLILLSDVEGLYTGPPADPDSKLITTFLPAHYDSISFGDKSRYGRGGMTAKVTAAREVANAGIPVVITSGYSADSFHRVLRGDPVGTLFHKDAHLWVKSKEKDARLMAVSAREASRKLQALSSSDRQNALYSVADALQRNEDIIRRENQADIMLAEMSGLSKPLLSRLTLKPGKVADLAKAMRALADMKEPIGSILRRTEVAENLILDKTTCPLGVILVVFESRPDALVQIASLAIKSGNGLLLKGGKEAARSNAILHKVITEALPKSVGKELIGLVTSRDEIPDLLQLDDVIDLVIPRGSNKLVSQIKESTKIPVLGHADGVCHVYVDKAARLEVAVRVVLDSKVDYPAACNAMETLLVHDVLIDTGGLEMLTSALKSAGVTLYGGERASKLLSIPQTANYHQEYSALACTVEVVKDVHAAIAHIHAHGSAHTDCIVTEDKEVAKLFLQRLDSAAVFHNASTRFSDGTRFGLGAEVGISTSRIHARGPVGVEGLLTTRWLLRGDGHVVEGDKGVSYTHKELEVDPMEEGWTDMGNGISVSGSVGKIKHCIDGVDSSLFTPRVTSVRLV